MNDPRRPALPDFGVSEKASGLPLPHTATVGNYPSYSSIPAMNTGR